MCKPVVINTPTVADEVEIRSLLNRRCPSGDAIYQKPNVAYSRVDGDLVVITDHPDVDERISSLRLCGWKKTLGNDVGPDRIRKFYPPPDVSDHELERIFSEIGNGEYDSYTV